MFLFCSMCAWREKNAHNSNWCLTWLARWSLVLWWRKAKFRPRERDRRNARNRPIAVNRLLHSFFFDWKFQFQFLFFSLNYRKSTSRSLVVRFSTIDFFFDPKACLRETSFEYEWFTQFEKSRATIERREIRHCWWNDLTEQILFRTDWYSLVKSIVCRVELTHSIIWHGIEETHTDNSSPAQSVSLCLPAARSISKYRRENKERGREAKRQPSTHGKRILSWADLIWHTCQILFSLIKRTKERWISPNRGRGGVTYSIIWH